MSLNDITNGAPRLVKPKDAEAYEVLQKVKKEVGAIRFAKDMSIADEAIDKIVDDALAGNKFVFTKAGIIFGTRSAICTVKDYTHIWDTAELAFPTVGTSGRVLDQINEHQLKFVGGILRWRVSVRPEDWYVYRRDSGTYNKYTGEEIKISEYWIKK